MKILIIGSGGREHALVWKLSQSRGVEKIFCCPGNGGIGEASELVPVPQGGWKAYADFAAQNKIDLTVVGPEVPLAEGIADLFRERGLKVFGPVKASARLEGSKVFSKNFMKKHGIPTADFQVFEDASKAIQYCKAQFDANPAPFSLVVKADGLAAGKGVSVCDSFEDARTAVEKMLVQKAFGAAGEKILIEERLTGEEFSLMAFCDGKSIQALPFAKDYKRVFERNEGPNTGGMGAIAPCDVPSAAREAIERQVVQAFLAAVQKEGLDYRGLIYFGIMLTSKGPYVLEFNVRFGDPETQVVLPLIKSDLAELFWNVADQTLGKMKLELHPEFCMSVVCASGGYPEKFENHKEISGLESFAGSSQNVFAFHAGTVREN